MHDVFASSYIITTTVDIFFLLTACTIIELLSLWQVVDLLLNHIILIELVVFIAIFLFFFCQIEILPHTTILIF